MEYLEHELKDLMDTMKYNFKESEIKCLKISKTNKNIVKT